MGKDRISAVRQNPIAKFKAARLAYHLPPSNWDRAPASRYFHMGRPRLAKTLHRDSNTMHAKKERDSNRLVLADRPMSKTETISRLTERQRMCLELVALGFTSKQIGRKLGISHSTVDNHVLAATQLLGVADRREAGRLVATSGQQLPRQAPDLTEPENSSIVGMQEAMQSSASAGLKLLPPIGGKLNEQTLGHKTVQILSIAFLSTLVVISMALLISGAFKAFS